MRTKTLLLTAALSAAGVASAMAQGSTVFSVNAVGFINLTLPPNTFTIIANQLNNGSNRVDQVFAGAPGGIALYKFTGSGYQVNVNDPDFGWDNPAMTLAPGEAAFARNPHTTNVVVTLVGEVPQGPLSNPIPGNQFSMESSQVPQAGLLQTRLEFPAAANDVVYLYRNGRYETYVNDPDFGWDPAQPNVNVGEGFFVRKAASANWTRTFNVNQ